MVTSGDPACIFLASLQDSRNYFPTHTAGGEI